MWNKILDEIRKTIHLYRLRRRYPWAVFGDGVTVGEGSEVGNNVTLFKNVHLWSSSIERYSYVQADSICNNAEIGPFCSIARNVMIGLVNHPIHMVSSSPVFYDNTQPLPRFFVDANTFPQVNRRTVIEADVWIGEGVRVMAGVRIGVGSVIGAGSVVTRDISPYTIAAGAPCRPIRFRFDEQIAKRLMKSEWWTLSDQELLFLAPHFSDPITLLPMIEQTR